MKRLFTVYNWVRLTLVIFIIVSLLAALKVR